MNFTSRHLMPELMDQPGLDRQLHRQALDGLRRVNRISATSSIFWPAIRDLASRTTGRTVRVLDVACGGGDVAISLELRAKLANIPMRIDGCDISDVAIDHARQQAQRAGVNVSFFQHDLFADELADKYDVVTCSLFLHHLSKTQAVALLKKLTAVSRSLVLIDDLLRTRLGYVLAWTGCRLLSRSPIVHYDGPQSVSAAFSIAEVQELVTEAGIGDVAIHRHWPQRFLLSWSRA